jgi:hypothetical protein
MYIELYEECSRFDLGVEELNALYRGKLFRDTKDIPD